jgi:outer membrane protein OmpA-like peptidoglycan-associated protein
MKKAFVLLSIMVLSIVAFPGCKASRQTKGAIIGATAGAAAGAVIAKDNKAVGILMGAAIGGVAGGLIGHYMDEQAEKIEEDLENAKVERVGEGILITFDSGILFDIESYALKPATKDNLTDLAVTLKKYEDTDVMVLGHTDNTGTEEYNDKLSQRRASSVRTYLVSQAVAGSRMTTEGYGETDPIATNETVDGRALNRRVEIVIVANKKLIRAAENGDLVITGN